MAFIAVLGKRWILYYTRATTWGSIVDQGKERQVKRLALQKWGLDLIMESLFVMLHFALLLFGIGLPLYLWNLNVVAAAVVLVVTSAGFIFYGYITIAATVWRDCPLQTPLSILLLRVPGYTRESTAPARTHLPDLLNHVFGTSIRTTPPAPPGEEMLSADQQMTLSNPAFWRPDPLFNSPLREDIGASAGFWLLENSTDLSAATALAAVFSEFQWPSHHPSPTALIRLRDTYMECFRGSEPKESTRVDALQSAVAYYLLYHTQLIWSTWKSLEVEVEKLPPDLPPDLLLHKYEDQWDGTTYSNTFFASMPTTVRNP